VEYLFIGKREDYYEDGSLYLINHNVSWRKFKELLKDTKLTLV
jgi:hypothetical protein